MSTVGRSLADCCKLVIAGVVTPFCVVMGFTPRECVEKQSACREYEDITDRGELGLQSCTPCVVLCLDLNMESVILFPQTLVAVAKQYSK